MVVITVQAYVEAGVHTIKVKNKKLFWVKIIDVQKGLGLKNMPDLVRKEICGIFETKSPTEEQNIYIYIRTENKKTKKPADDYKYKYACSDLMEKMIKGCRGVKQCNDGVNRLEKEIQRENFRTILGFKEHEIMNREEYTIASQIEQVFANEKIKPQHFVLNKYYIDYYFPEHKLAVEIDKKAHLDRNEDKDKRKRN